MIKSRLKTKLAKKNREIYQVEKVEQKIMLTDIAPSVPGQFYSSHHSQMGITNIAPHIQKTVSKQQPNKTKKLQSYFSMEDPKHGKFLWNRINMSIGTQTANSLTLPRTTSMLSLAWSKHSVKNNDWYNTYTSQWMKKKRFKWISSDISQKSGGTILPRSCCVSFISWKPWRKRAEKERRKENF